MEAQQDLQDTKYKDCRHIISDRLVHCVHHAAGDFRKMRTRHGDRR